MIFLMGDTVTVATPGGGTGVQLQVNLSTNDDKVSPAVRLLAAAVRNNILGLNPMGIYLKASGEYDNSVLWNGTLLPICPNMIGGILLFPAVLEEKADHIYEQGKNLLTAVLRNGSCFFHGRRILA